MCGIIGFKDTKEMRDSLEDCFELIAHRGEDSYGYIAEGKKLLCDKTIDIKPFLEKVNKLPKSNFILTHNRKASIGAKTTDLAHPITSSNGQVTIIHNGTKRDLYDAHDTATSDTVAAAELLGYHFAADDLVANLLEGIGVVFAKHHKTGKVLLFVDGKRSLFINSTGTIIASEPLNEDSWYLVTPQLKIFKSFTHMMENLEYNPKYVTAQEETHLPALCPCCNKTHLIPASLTRCYECEVLDKKPNKTRRTYYSGYGYNYYDSTAWDDDYNNLDPLEDYDIGKAYEFSDDKEKWISGILTGQGQSDAYPYRANNTVYKYIREVPIIVEVSKEPIKPVLGKFYTVRTENDQVVPAKLIGYTSKGTAPYKVSVIQGIPEIQASKLISELPNGTIPALKQTYNFADYLNSKNWKTAKLIGYSVNKSYPYRVVTTDKTQTSYAHFKPINKTKPKIKSNIVEALHPTRGWVEAYKPEENTHNKLCTAVKDGRLFAAISIRQPTIVKKNEKILVTKGNNVWQAAISLIDIYPDTKPPFKAKLLSSTQVDFYLGYRKMQ